MGDLLEGGDIFFKGFLPASFRLESILPYMSPSGV
jgi:hypothetical protein